MSNGRIRNPFNPNGTRVLPPQPTPSIGDSRSPNFSNGLKPLSEQQNLFVKYYVETNYKAAEAAEKSGYNRNYGRNLLQMPNVRDAVSKETERRNRRIEISQDNVLNELGILAFSNLTDLFTDFGKGRSLQLKPKDELTPEQQRMMASISETWRGTSRTLKFRAHDKLRALTLLAQYMGILDGSGKQIDPEGMAQRLRDAAAKGLDSLPKTPTDTGDYEDDYSEEEDY